MGSNDIDRLVSLVETRHRLGGIGNTMLYELISRGELVKVNIGRRRFITSKSLAAYVVRVSEGASV